MNRYVLGLCVWSIFLKIKQTLGLFSSYTLNRKQILNTKKEQYDE
jgi:hypothetical protein